MTDDKWHGDVAKEDFATERQVKFLWTYGFRNARLLSNVFSKEELCVLRLSDSKTFFGNLTKRRAGEAITAIKNMEHKQKMLGKRKTPQFVKFVEGYCEYCDMPMRIVETGYECNLCDAEVVKVGLADLR